MKRSKIVDLMKAIGIILVVIGHCIPNAFVNRFIYIFHLPLFFMLSGYLYNEQESKEPWQFIGKKMKKFIILYISYGSFFVIFHNIFLYMGVLDASKYTLENIVVGIINSCLFQSSEPYSAAMWFIPVLLVCLIVYNFITSAVTSIHDTKEKELKRSVLILILTIIGLYLNNRGCNVGLHYQTVFIAMPFIHIGQIIKLYVKDKLSPNLIVSIIDIFITIICLLIFNGEVELSQNKTWNPFLFYTLASLLIYVVYTICFYIDKMLPKISTILEYIGKNTFQIMCLHILSFKVFDYIFIKAFTKNYDILSKFTTSYSRVWPIYVLIGIILPLITVYALKRTKIYISEKWKLLNKNILTRIKQLVKIG